MKSRGVMDIVKFYKDIGLEYTKRFSISTIEGKWDKLEKEVLQCRKCGLCKTKKNAVFGGGNINADIMFVGEAPGRDEDIQGKPFVGRAGKLLNELLRDVGINREDVYIANCLKCRPPNNRDPETEEIKACSAYLKQQIALVKPKVIATLGRYSTYELTNKKGTLGSLRGKTFSFNNIDVIPLYHPAYLLRNPNAAEMFITDLKKIKSAIG